MSVCPNPGKRRRPRRWLSTALALAGAATLGWFGYVYAGIHYYATHDQARPADAIAIFGAAEYDGRPSPVLRARLMHGLALYREKLAPLVITLGGGESGERHSEGGVGEEFLMARGVPQRSIIAETESRDTRESAAQLAAIARDNHLRSLLVVSDGTHLFRIRALCRQAGLVVYTSPRQQNLPLSVKARLSRVAHEVLSYTAWQLGLLR